MWKKEDGIGKTYWEGDQLFGHQNSIITKYNQHTGTKLWDINLGKYGNYSINGELKKIDLQVFIGTHNGLIYIKAGSQLILGINFNTGEVEFECKYMEGFLVLDNLKIDKAKNCIFSIGPRHYIEINLQNSNYEITDLTEQTTTHEVETTNIGGWVANNIYFWEGSINNKFGEFSREDKTINWSKSINDVAGKFPAIKNIKYEKKKLYINDSNSRLHIYQLNEYAS